MLTLYKGRTGLKDISGGYDKRVMSHGKYFSWEVRDVKLTMLLGVVRAGSVPLSMGEVVNVQRRESSAPPSMSSMALVTRRGSTKGRAISLSGDPTLTISLAIIRASSVPYPASDYIRPQRRGSSAPPSLSSMALVTRRVLTKGMAVHLAGHNMMLMSCEDATRAESEGPTGIVHIAQLRRAGSLPADLKTIQNSSSGTTKSFEADVMGALGEGLGSTGDGKEDVSGEKAEGQAQESTGPRYNLRERKVKAVVSDEDVEDEEEVKKKAGKKRKVSEDHCTRHVRNMLIGWVQQRDHSPESGEGNKRTKTEVCEDTLWSNIGLKYGILD